MQIIENWADITGEIESVLHLGAIDGFIEVNVKVSRADDVGDFPNLLKEAVGQTLTVQMPASVAQTTLAPGDRVTFRVRRAGLNRIYANPEHIHIIA
jgi:hypothetical protein